MRILIAEDDEFTRRLYKIIFSKDELKICVNGQEFIENYSKEYDVFIIDLKMPVQDGNSVLRFLKAVGNQTPIVICSAQPTITIDRGNILIIGKPIDSLTLRDKIYNYTKKINVLNKKSDLEHLELLTNNLPGVPTIENLIKPNQDNNKCVNYKAIKGTVFGIPIMWTEGMAIQKVFFSKNSEFDFHVHQNSTEMVIVLSGELKVEYASGKPTKIIKKNEMFSITKNEEHNASTLVDTWIVAVTVPADTFYPKP